METDLQGCPVIGLADVIFVGGPFHGRRMAMANPEFRMTLELETGECVEYCRRGVEAEMRDGRYLNIATCALVGMDDEEFGRLVINQAAVR